MGPRQGCCARLGSLCTVKTQPAERRVRVSSVSLELDLPWAAMVPHQAAGRGVSQTVPGAERASGGRGSGCT